jgi:hypothetical protein
MYHIEIVNEKLWNQSHSFGYKVMYFTVNKIYYKEICDGHVIKHV